MDESGEITELKRVATPPDYPNLLASLTRLIRDLESAARGPCVVGFGTPGAWIPSRRAMKNCNNTTMLGKPFLDDMQRILNRPLRIANDADCFALSEAHGGVGRGADCVFGVILGTGVGGGWVFKGQLVQGPNSLAGEWGHNPLPRLREDSYTVDLEAKLADRDCYCGQKNCVETFLSGRGIAETHRELTGEEITGSEIPQSAHSELTLSLYCAMLARSLAYVVNILDPDLIVLGGGVSNLTAIYEKVPKLLHRYAFSTEGLTKVVPAMHGDSSGSRGAAWLFPPDFD